MVLGPSGGTDDGRRVEVRDLVGPRYVPKRRAMQMEPQGLFMGNQKSLYNRGV